VSASGVLELAIALIREHHAAHGAGLQVISVLDNELDQNHEIYGAVLRRMGGAYIAVDKMAQSRVKGAVDAGLKDIVQEGLRRSPIQLAIEIEQEREDVLVRRADGIEPVNESERLILSFVAALFSRELEGRAVAVISWTENRLEFLAKESLWQLIRAHVSGRRFGALETLVFIAGGRVEPELHCEHDASVLFALSERGLSRRKGRSSLQAAVGKLVRDSERLLVLFLGAGASASAGMPLGNEVRDYALEHFFGDIVPPAVSELAIRFHQWVRDNGRLLAGEEELDARTFAARLTLERVLREEFQREGRDQSLTLRHLREQNENAIARKKTRVRKGLRSIVEKRQRLVIVTVNFDMILEDEFGDRLRVFATPADFKWAADYLRTYKLEGGAVPALKLHGSLAVPDSIVADVDTRSLGLPSGTAEALQLLLGEHGLRTPWVYIGASMRDPDITEVIGGGDFAERLDEWWVSPFPDPSVALFVEEHRASRWQKAGQAEFLQRQITETADTFLSALSGNWPDQER